MDDSCLFGTILAENGKFMVFLIFSPAINFSITQTRDYYDLLM